MKIILSRKGFDSSNGGCASPIFPDGRLLSLPISASGAPTRFSDVGFEGLNLGQIVGELSRGKVLPDSSTHLDPDLSNEALLRQEGWLPAFGQTGAAQSHLNSQGVEVGDLFLFFGWFRSVEKNARGIWQFVPGAPDCHVLFGWLQVGQILRVGPNTREFADSFPWLAQHPHLNGERSDSNTIYVASQYLDLLGLTQPQQLAGGGVFRNLSEGRTLTAPNQTSRSLWRLPAFFAPSGNGRAFSYHADPARWKSDDEGWVRLQSVAKGQEFVMELPDIKEKSNWLDAIFDF